VRRMAGETMEVYRRAIAARTGAPR
jgi:hypothetical protein